MCTQPTSSCVHLGLQADRADRTTVLTVAGELDISAAPELIAAVREACGTGFDLLVVDTGGVTFVDAAGLRGLLGGYHPAVVSAVRFRNASPAVVRLLDMVGMLHLVEAGGR